MSYIDPRSKVLYHADRITQLRNIGMTSAPVNVEIDLSNRCSHGCEWCHFAYTHVRGPLVGKQDKPEHSIDGGDLMDFDLACRILLQLKDAGVKSVTWTGGGEPTIYPRFNDAVLRASSLGIDQGIYTNGGSIDLDRAEILKRLLTFVYVSLDECTPESFKRSKGVDRFSNVIEGIDNLVKSNGDATIGVGFLLHKNNYRDVDAMVDLGRSFGVDYIQFRPVVSYDQVNPGVASEDTSWAQYAIENLEQYQDDKFIVSDLWRFDMYADWDGHGYQTCNWSAMQTVITPNGKVWRCVNKREHESALLGDLSTQSFREIWSTRAGPCTVDSECRVMCRGHIANLTLDQILKEPPHKNFI